MPITIYIVGSWTRPEFSDARHWLQSNTKAVRFSNLATVRQAIESGQRDPEWVLLIQSRPGQFSPREVAELRIVAPLTRICLLNGTWCEGETRSGFPLPDVPRYTWLTLKSNMMGESQSRPSLRSLDSHKSPNSHSELRVPSTASLPFTTPDQDRWRAELNGWKHAPSRRIAVYSADPAQSQALCDALSARGHHPQRNRLVDSNGCDAFIWDDAGGRRTPRLTPLQALHQLRLPTTTPRVVLRTFPRIQTVEADRRDGFAATLAKPFQVSDLLAQIEFSLADADRKTFAA